MHARRIVCPHHDFAAVAMRECIGIHLHARRDERRRSVLLRTFPLVVPADQHSPAPCIAGSVDPCTAEQAHLVAQHLDRPAGFARARAGHIERPGDGDHAAFAALQADDTVVFGYAGSADEPCVVHHGSCEVARGARRHDHGAAVGLDQVTVFHQRPERGLVHHQAHQPVAREIQRDLVARGQRSSAHARRNHAFVAHFWREQRNGAALRGT